MAIRFLLAGLCVWAVCNPVEASGVKQEKSGTSRYAARWWERSRPQDITPEAQLERANMLRDTGHTIRAGRAYRALLNAWPASAQAPVALQNYADLLERRGKLQKAFEEYQFLTEAYSGFFPYDEVMDRMYHIADVIATRDRYFLFFKFKAPEDAVPLFEKLIANGVQWKRAAELQFRMARIYEKTEQYDMAVQAYGMYHQRYPIGALAESALFGQARCYQLYAAEHPQSLDLREEALAAVQGFLDWYPRSPMAEEARRMLETLQNELAMSLYAQARLYDRSARLAGNPEAIQSRRLAARLSYQRLLDEYPGSVWADRAMMRVRDLNSQLQSTL